MAVTFTLARDKWGHRADHLTSLLPNSRHGPVQQSKIKLDTHGEHQWCRGFLRAQNTRTPYPVAMTGAGFRSRMLPLSPLKSTPIVTYLAWPGGDVCKVISTLFLTLASWVIWCAIGWLMAMSGGDDIWLPCQGRKKKEKRTQKKRLRFPAARGRKWLEFADKLDLLFN